MTAIKPCKFMETAGSRSHFVRLPRPFYKPICDSARYSAILPGEIPVFFRSPLLRCRRLPLVLLCRRPCRANPVRGEGWCPDWIACA